MTVHRTHPKTVARVTRVIRAPRQRVFDAWTSAEEIKKWFGRSEGVVIPDVEVDLRVGGEYRIVMQAESGGPEYPVSGKYVEVTPPERLVYTFQWERDLPFDFEDFRTETRVTIQFRDLGTDTEVELTHEGFLNTDLVGFHEQGWTTSFDRLVELLEPS